MTHFAKVLDGVVKQVICAEAEFFETFVDSSPGQWLQTSYNTRGGLHYSSVTGEPDGGAALRGNYAGIGFIYDYENDVFYPPRPVDKNKIPCFSWTITSPTWEWEPPVPRPSDEHVYVWNETNQMWEQI